MTIVNDASRVINMLEASLIDEARVVIYDHHIFIVQATDQWLNSVDQSHLIEEEVQKLRNLPLTCRDGFTGT
jgi:hypothetical protein